MNTLKPEEEIYFKTVKEKNNYIREWVDRLIIKFPMLYGTEIYSLIIDEIPKSSDRGKINSVYKSVIEFMIVNGYIAIYKDSMALYELTQKGREMKLIGGYFEYIKSQRKRDWLKIILIVISVMSLICVIIFGVLNLKKNNKTEKLEKENIELRKKIQMKK